MTKKQELIAFIQNNVTDTKQLKVGERVISAPAESMLNANEMGYCKFGVDKEAIVLHITNSYSDDLQISKNGVVRQILFWFTADVD